MCVYVYIYTLYYIILIQAQRLTSFKALRRLYSGFLKALLRLYSGSIKALLSLY